MMAKLMEFFSKLFDMFFNNLGTTEKFTVAHVPIYLDVNPDVEVLQRALNKQGANLDVDGDFGTATRKAISAFQKSKELAGSGILGPKTLKFLRITVEALLPKGDSKAPWFWELKKYSGKHETNPAFNKLMSSKWKLVGLNLGTISKNWAAWCGLFLAVGLSATGYQWQKDGATAKNWDKFGVKLEWRVNGFPQGAFIRVNHGANCKTSGGNHVTLSNGACTARDLTKPGATFSGYGGNQGNMAKVSTYRVSTICSVTWPKDAPLPKKIMTSVNCSNGKTNKNESTQ